MKVYHYHPDTKEYLGTTEARLDPLETLEQGVPVHLIPAQATDTEPLKPQPNQAVVFVDGQWQYINDNRGQKYYQEDGTEVIITGLGDEVPPGALLEPPTETLAEPDPTEVLIAQKIRALAITTLKQEGKLPANYIDKKLGA